MKLLIVSTAPFIYKNSKTYAYSPYVNELIVLERYADKIIFCCPTWKKENGLLVSEIPFSIDKHFKLIDLNFNSLVNILRSFFYAIYNSCILFKVMNEADHIHLRCPGNIGLLGSIVQIFFPKKQKTAKYAGNWDLNAKQPLSYKLQKWILNNTILTKNMQVLVYGNWEKSTKNIKPFFTATYSDNEIIELLNLDMKKQISFIFVGTLVSGKNPLYAIQLIERLYKKGYNVAMNLYGEGNERNNLENYISEKKIESYIHLEGNQNRETLKKAYQNSYFVVLPSKSEGWPKAIAEGMFWGCIPIATDVSCISFMLDNGKRGILLEMDLERDVIQIENIIKDESSFLLQSKLAAKWSQQYTTNVFESEIKKLLVK